MGDMEHFPIVAGVGVAVVFWLLTFRVFFKGRDDFFDAIRLWMTPDIVSAFRGEWGEDMWSSTKLMIWIGAGACIGVIVLDSFK